MLTGGQVAALIVAVFWAILVCFLGYVLVKLAGMLTETTKLISGVADRTAPLLDEVASTVTRVDGQLERVDAITRNVESVSENVSTMAALVSATVSGPLVKVAAFTYGVRKAVSDRRRRAVTRRGGRRAGS